jgi:16S rRNA (guanine527-N7)-methyltransferase
MWPSSLDMNVSRESMEKLEAYHALLLKWQRAINLVSPKTIDDAWMRHFADSAQVERYVPDGVKTVADLGSGGGFAGMVLAIMRPELHVHFIESDERKCQFLRTVSRETNTPVTVHTQRIEAPIEGFVPDCVTARALADLPTLLGFVANWAAANPALECVFLKGARADDEVSDAREQFAFDVQSHISVTDPLARILCLKNIALNA